ncbi:MAG: PrgI family protein [Candidatus Falkowbacteria bacterium]
MQQFTVPQFIDVEDKIIGPITARQFIIFIIAAIIIGISYRLFDSALFSTVGITTFLLAVVLGFVKVNGRPFHFFLLNLIQTWRRPNIRVWNNRLAKVVDTEKIPTLKFDSTKSAKEYYEKSRLAELSLVVDTEGEYRGADDENNLEIIN